MTPSPPPGPTPRPDPDAAHAHVFDEYGDHDHRAVRRVDPEHNLIACLLNMPADAAAEVLALVRDDDLADSLACVVLAWIRALVARNEAPTPQAVAALARGPVANEEPHPGPERVARYVVEVFTLGLPLTVWSTTRQVVDDSYRRSFGDYGTRAAQMAEGFADVEDLEQLTVTALREWRGTWWRLRTLTIHANGTTPE